MASSAASPGGHRHRVPHGTRHRVPDGLFAGTHIRGRTGLGALRRHGARAGGELVGAVAGPGYRPPAAFPRRHVGHRRVRHGRAQVLFQRIGQVTRGRIAIVRPLLQHPVARNCVTSVGMPGPKLFDRIRLLGLMTDQFLHVRPARERRLAGQDVVERAAERIEVGPDVNLPGVAGLFRGDEVRRAQSAGPSQRGVLRRRLVLVQCLRSAEPAPCRGF